MIGSTRSVLAACTGSAQSLSRSLSPVDRVPAESSPVAPRSRLFSRWKLLTHIPAYPLPRRIRYREPQKAIQYSETRSGSVQ
jgi:hypothetical protein